MHVSDLPDRSQDYLKKIYDLQDWGQGGASLSELAEELGQRRSTASEAVKKLAADGLVHHAPYGDITLSEGGLAYALQMVRRHRLIETYLLRELGYGVDEVHDEAEILEHAVSDTFIARIDAVMGYPTRDPHGDPIPDASGRVAVPPTVPMSEVKPGRRVLVDRISDRDPALLRYLQDNGITPGVHVDVADRPYPDMAVLTVEGEDVQVSVASLSGILCRTDGAQEGTQDGVQNEMPGEAPA
ncbi:MAG TPA: metal-dependent transcriptional regulator [Candidatus Corynebacterium avicola]|uniref:Diphtheria toxin repressor n=1 Tax=Candidatus Corynebacterium avicola TaxID=2838527 RepID=A0A9D1UJU0_9CORY|nr:metal-dependent transcriptional regulator [Candidatus Corynebacterium avicola]